MSSPTLNLIMEHWSGPLPGDAGCIELPFDIQAFCVENDRLTAEVERWEELCGSMLIYVMEGAGERRAERFEQEYEALRSE